MPNSGHMEGFARAARKPTIVGSQRWSRHIAVGALLTGTVPLGLAGPGVTSAAAATADPTEEELRIAAADVDGVVSDLRLLPGMDYELVVEGTYAGPEGLVADAECSPSAVGLWSANRPDGGPSLDLLVDGREVAWLPERPTMFGCDAAHRYRLRFRVAAEGPVALRIDGGENQAAFTGELVGRLVGTAFAPPPEPEPGPEPEPQPQPESAPDPVPGPAPVDERTEPQDRPPQAAPPMPTAREAVAADVVDPSAPSGASEVGAEPPTAAAAPSSVQRADNTAEEHLRSFLVDRRDVEAAAPRAEIDLVAEAPGPTPKADASVAVALAAVAAAAAIAGAGVPVARAALAGAAERRRRLPWRTGRGASRRSKSETSTDAGVAPFERSYFG